MVYFVLQLISHPCIIRARQRSTDMQVAFWALVILCFWLSILRAEPPCISWIMKAPFIYWSVCLHWPMLLPAMLFTCYRHLFRCRDPFTCNYNPKVKNGCGQWKIQTLGSHQILSELSAIRLITYGPFYITHSIAAFCLKSTLKKHHCHWTRNWGCQLKFIIRLITITRIHS